MRRHLITALFVAGWIVPSVQPGYCVAFGASQQLVPYSDYRVEIYLGQCGWFSQGVTLDHRMEVTHGRTRAAGPWFGGYLLAIGVTVTGIAGNYVPQSRFILVPLWMIVRPILVLLAFYAFLYEWLVWRAVLMGVVLIVYSTFALYYKRSCEPTADDVNSRRLIGLSILFFPMWVAALCVVQSTWLFVGLALTLAAVLLMLFERREVVPVS